MHTTDGEKPALYGKSAAALAEDTAGEYACGRSSIYLAFGKNKADRLGIQKERCGGKSIRFLCVRTFFISGRLRRISIETKKPAAGCAFARKKDDLHKEE